MTFIQTSAAISSGSSGGALINKYGDVIGITSAKFKDGENLGLALPMSVISGYNKDKLLPFSGVAKEENTEYDAETVLAAFIYKNANEEINEAIAYTERKETDEGYIEASAALNDDYSLEVIIWIVNGYETCYVSIDLSGGKEKFLYYDYEDELYGDRFIGGAFVDAAKVREDWRVRFEETEENVGVGDHDETAALAVLLGLSFINVVFGYVEDFGDFSVADFGFINY